MRYIDSTTSTTSSSRFSSTEIVGARELALLLPGKPNKSKLSAYIRQTAASHPKFASKNKYLCPFLSFSMLPSLLKRIYTDISVVRVERVDQVFAQHCLLSRTFLVGNFVIASISVKS